MRRWARWFFHRLGPIWVEGLRGLKDSQRPKLFLRALVGEILEHFKAGLYYRWMNITSGSLSGGKVYQNEKWIFAFVKPEEALTCNDQKQEALL